MTTNSILNGLHNYFPRPAEASPGSVLPATASILFNQIIQKSVPTTPQWISAELFQTAPPLLIPEITIELDKWKDEVKGLPEFDARVKASEKIFQCYSSKSDQLDLVGLELTSLPSCIGKCSQLKQLLLMNNQLASLPEEIGNLSNLELLSLPNNRLASLPESIGNLSNLGLLSLSNNRLNSLPESIGNCLRLKLFYVENNDLRALPDSLGNCSNLRTLDASKNQLISLPDFTNFPKLEVLNLGNNQLASIPESIGNCNELKQCRLSHNCLISLPESLGKCSKLRSLFASENYLTSLPESLGHCSQLEDLYLVDNHLRSLPVTIGHCSLLESLDLSKNLFDSFPESLSKCGRLRNLFLSNNRLTSLPDSMRDLPAIQFIVLSGNPIQYPLPPWLADLANRVSILMDDPLPKETLIRSYNMSKALGFKISPIVARVSHATAPSFGPKISELLKQLGAVVQEPDINFSIIDPDALGEEVVSGFSEIRENNPASEGSIPAQLLRNAKPDSLIQKIKDFAENIVANCQGIALPGGNNVEPEFYDSSRGYAGDDYRRSIAEFALIAAAEKAKKPVIGTCRGAQMLNVYRGGTLRDVDEQLGLQELVFTESLEKERKEQLKMAMKSDSPTALSRHYQACDKIAEGFEVAMHFKNIPKLIIGNDGLMIGTQAHPEDEYANGIYSKFIGIYELFFQKMPKPAHSF